MVKLKFVTIVNRKYTFILSCCLANGTVHKKVIIRIAVSFILFFSVHHLKQGLNFSLRVHIRLHNYHSRIKATQQSQSLYATFKHINTHRDKILSNLLACIVVKTFPLSHGQTVDFRSYSGLSSINTCTQTTTESTLTSKHLQQYRLPTHQKSQICTYTSACLQLDKSDK